MQGKEASFSRPEEPDTDIEEATRQRVEVEESSEGRENGVRSNCTLVGPTAVIPEGCGGDTALPGGSSGVPDTSAFVRKVVKSTRRRRVEDEGGDHEEQPVAKRRKTSPEVSVISTLNI